MEASGVELLASLRIVVGYLGERRQYGWWQSEFFGAGSNAFLAPIFGKTQRLAQATGVTRAAALIHDERIGVGDVYHLFRLPEDLEQSLHRALHETTLIAQLDQLLTDQATAVAQLQAMSNTATAEQIGPTRIGDLNKLRSADGWAVAAAHYGRAFTRGQQTYPYFSNPAA